ncbi:hypothetical protein D187_008433 [Cystobacter fuscus DSM 2262]|uniref:Uncharacterized protein n=1 Tax=Cystobacter fuscus (strain ATCC 25194 / DSM 2262 / NBRC 100088 / M29) TaxID=1242864 RepID=S9PGP3_CYSF2|nr:hypothetical protein D187_008433 [Cystobacter fuscus DSM 2262]
MEVVPGRGHGCRGGRVVRGLGRIRPMIGGKRAGIVVGLRGMGPMRGGGIGAGRRRREPDLVGHDHDLEAGVGSATDSEVAVGHTDTSRVPLGLRWGIEQWPCQPPSRSKGPDLLGRVPTVSRFPLLPW